MTAARWLLWLSAGSVATVLNIKASIVALQRGNDWLASTCIFLAIVSVLLLIDTAKDQP